MERRNGGKTVLAEQVVCISHHQHQPLLTFIYLFQFEGVNLQLFRPLNFTLMSSGFLFNIRKKDAKEEKHCVIFLMVCNRLLSELKGITCKRLNISRRGCECSTEVVLSITNCQKMWYYGNTKGSNAKTIFHLLSAHMTASDPGSVRCSQICSDRYFIV